MKTLSLRVPDSVSQQEMQSFLAAKLFEQGTLSLGQAAEMAGFSKRDFMTMLVRYGVSVFNASAELEKDVMNAKRYSL